ncbi:acyl-CoA dehydrogenase [Staphylococcus arlettae]|uniref:acyl-CoA dehydrogenase n=1 Tax=Staphylococcus arlettae TaxID=29378 RepID=UPI002DB76189|nr:acyl-CoA dehydrogenase [Staphylococcus arlettae]MEB5898542.1 acyl-CoA dehydrogenase [Staphylococcus arlettae]
MTLNTLIENKLDPYLVEIDDGSHYAKDFIQDLFKENHFSKQDIEKNLLTIEQVSNSCLTTGFCLWCELAFSTYLQHASTNYLNTELQNKLLNGEILGATGLSNPMKSFNDLEAFNLNHYYIDGTLYVNGKLPAVSNIGDDHYFGAISKAQDGEELVMFIVRANQEGIKLTEMSNFLGVNGSATYTIQFDDVIIPEKHIITKDAKSFATQIRPQFVTLQIPIALGSIRSSLDLIHKFSTAQNGINQYLDYDVDAYEAQYQQLRTEFYELVHAHKDELSAYFADIIRIKKEAGYLLLEVNQVSMVNGGARAYSHKAPQARKLKEGFFFAALTPTLRHLGKLEAELKQQA